MSTSNEKNINGMWARVIVSTLFKNGIKDVCISPGNRNTPLTLAMTNHPGILCTSHIDERSTGYPGTGISGRQKT